MVDRRDRQVDVAVPGGDAEQVRQVAEQLAHVRRVDRRQAPLDALGAAGGSRGVVHGGTGGAAPGGVDGLTLEERGVGAEPVDRSDGEAPVRGQAGLVDGSAGPVGEPLAGHEHLGVGVFEDVRHLGPHQVPVDRGDVQPDLERRQVDLHQLDGVRQQQGHRVAHLEPQRPQAVGDLVRAVEQRSRGALIAVGAHQSQSVTVSFGETPEPQFSHGRGL